MTPHPVRVRFFNEHKKIVGHWFIRPDQHSKDPEAWKLSIWHPDSETITERRCYSGTGYENAIWTLIGVISETEATKWEDYKIALQKAQQAVRDQKAGRVKPKPGFRKNVFRKLLSQLQNEWHGWARHQEKHLRSHLEFIFEKGWPRVEIPQPVWKDEKS